MSRWNWVKNALAGSGVVALVFFFTLPAQAGDLDWPTQRHDNGRTGRSNGKGNITKPVVTHEIKVGSTTDATKAILVDADLDGELDLLLVEGDAVSVRNSKDQVIWRTKGLGASRLAGIHDLDGNGTHEVVILSDGPPAAITLLSLRYGEVLWRFDDFGAGASSLPFANVAIADVTTDGLLNLLASTYYEGSDLFAFGFSEGFKTRAEDNVLWQKTLRRYNRTVSFLVDDLNGDGRNEIVSQHHDALSVLDGETGSTVLFQEGLFSNHMFGPKTLIDVTGDGRPEYISFGITRNNQAVAVIDPVNGRALWSYEWYPTELKQVQFPYGAITDIDLDGTIEIIFSVFNDTDDELIGPHSSSADWDGIVAPMRWATLIVNAETGAVENTFLDTAVVAIFDPGYGKKPRIVIREDPAPQPTLSKFGKLNVYELSDIGTLSPLLNIGRASLITHIEPPSPTLNTQQQPYFVSTIDINSDGLPDISFEIDYNGDSIAESWSFFSLGSLTPERIAEFPLLVAQAREIPVIKHLGFAYLGLQTLDNGVELLDSTTQSISSFVVSGTSPIILSSNIDKRNGNEIIVNAGFEKSTVFSKQMDSYNMIDEKPYEELSAIVAGDIDGDGLDEIITASRVNGTTHIVETRKKGNTLWSNAFEYYGSYINNIATARLNGDEFHDVVFTTRDTRLANGDDVRLISLNGIDGSVLWNVGTLENYFPNAPLVLHDFDRDGLDDILLLDVNNAEIYSGLDGTLLSSFDYPGKWATSSLLVDNSNQPSTINIIIGTHYSNPGLVSWDYTNDILKFNIDNRFEGEIGDSFPVLFRSELEWGLIKHNTQGLIEAFNSEGNRIWGPSHYIEGNLALLNDLHTNKINSVSIADIDGDGRDDSILGTNDGFVIALNALDGSVLWSLPVYSSVSETITSDVDGDGLLEILASTSAGEVLVIDQEPISGPSSVFDVKLDDDLSISNPSMDIDETSQIGALAATWDTVDGAIGYRYRIIDDQNTIVNPWSSCSPEREAVVETPPLNFDRSYYFTVQACLDSGKFSSQTVSDGVRLVDKRPPKVNRLVAKPRVVDSFKKNFRLDAILSDNVWLDRYILAISDCEGAVKTFSNNLYGTKSTISQIWDGTDDSGNLVPGGHYTVNLQVFDSAGLFDTRGITVFVFPDGQRGLNEVCEREKARGFWGRIWEKAKRWWDDIWS